jgi:hypothetical protein
VVQREAAAVLCQARLTLQHGKHEAEHLAPSSPPSESCSSVISNTTIITTAAATITTAAVGALGRTPPQGRSTPSVRHSPLRFLFLRNLESHHSAEAVEEGVQADVEPDVQQGHLEGCPCIIPQRVAEKLAWQVGPEGTQHDARTDQLSGVG